MKALLKQEASYLDNFQRFCVTTTTFNIWVELPDHFQEMMMYKMRDSF